MSTFLWIVLIFILLIISLVVLLKNSHRKLELRKVKWQEEEENCQIDEISGSKYESWHYKDNETEITVGVTWADMKSGFRIYMDGFRDGSGIIPIEENKIIVARMLKYLGFVMGRDTLKLNYEGFAQPSDELIKEIEDKIKPIGYVRMTQDESKEITWSKK